MIIKEQILLNPIEDFDISLVPAFFEETNGYTYLLKLKNGEYVTACANKFGSELKDIMFFVIDFSGNRISSSHNTSFPRVCDCFPKDIDAFALLG
jgi:hypothetical protein